MLRLTTLAISYCWRALRARYAIIADIGPLSVPWSYLKNEAGQAHTHR